MEAFSLDIPGVNHRWISVVSSSAFLERNSFSYPTVVGSYTREEGFVYHVYVYRRSLGQNLPTLANQSSRVRLCDNERTVERAIYVNMGLKIDIESC